MIIPERVAFYSDVLIQSSLGVSDTALCFSCAVRYVTAGGKVTCQLVEEDRGCWNKTCREGGTPVPFEAPVEVAPPPVSSSLSDDIPF